MSCLESVASQTVLPDQILIADGMSTDKTREIVAEFAARCSIDIELLDNPRKTIPSALNIAARAAREPILVRIDAHVHIESDYIERCLKHLKSGKWAGVGGTKIATASTSFGRAAADAFGLPLLAGSATYHHSGAESEVDHIPFGAYPRYIVMGLAGWDEQLTVNQDFEFDFRVRQAGGRLLYDPKIITYWRGRETPTALFHQYRRYGWGKVQVWLKHPSSFRIRLLAPVAAAGAVLAPLSFARRLGVRAFVPGVAYFVSLTIVHGIARRTIRIDRSARAASAVATMHAGFAAGLVEGVVRRLRGLDRADEPYDLFKENPTR